MLRRDDTKKNVRKSRKNDRVFFLRASVERKIKKKHEKTFFLCMYIDHFVYMTHLSLSLSKKKCERRI